MKAEVDVSVPVVAVVGRPNVGKSSLVNRILGRREAIVEATPGVTRDRHAFEAQWRDRRFELIDTGGLEPGAQGLDARVTEQAQVAVELADVVVLVVDATVGPLDGDRVVAKLLRRSGKPILLVANKVDDARREPDAAEFYRLGLGDPIPLSALHGRGSGDFLDALVARLPEDRTPEDGAWGALAIVGRPNVGKSSLLNALLGEERAIVDVAPGTTRDPVDARLAFDGTRDMRVVDTAGMRRQVHIKDPLEYFSFLRSRKVLTRVDCALLVVDASEGVTGLDQRIAEEIANAGRACVIALNKWDLVTTDETERARIERDIAIRLRFMSWARWVRTSAPTNRGVDKLVPELATAIASHRRRLATAEVNRIVARAQAQRPHPRSARAATRVLYALQASTRPPSFVMFANHRLETSYVRYLENQIRAAEAFAGSPIRVQVRVKARRDGESS